MGASINNLPARQIKLADQIPFASTENGQDGRTSASQLAEVIATSFATSGALVTQYVAPSATGFTVAVTTPTSGASMWLLLRPNATYATGTIVLPAVDTLAEGQEVAVSCTQIVTALTVSGNGATVSGAPTTLAAGGFFRMRYDRPSLTWYRIA